jgi:hypothetical protein
VATLFHVMLSCSLVVLARHVFESVPSMFAVAGDKKHCCFAAVDVSWAVSLRIVAVLVFWLCIVENKVDTRELSMRTRIVELDVRPSIFQVLEGEVRLV